MRHIDTGRFSLSTNHLLKLLIIPLLFVGTSYAQSVTGSYTLIGVKVQYIDVARDTTGTTAGSDTTEYGVPLAWPSAASPLLSLDLLDFAVGDTIAAPATPDSLLTKEGLANFVLGAINLTIALDQTAGTMTIPASGTGTSTYPTISLDLETCTTTPVVLPVTDLASLEFSTNVVVNETNNTVTWGLGIAESEIFAWFDPADPTVGPSSQTGNWGLITAHYTGDPTASESIIDTLTVEWFAIDGAASNLGVDDIGNLDRQLGIATLPANTAFIGAMATAAQAAEITINVGNTVGAFIDPEIAAELGIEAATVSDANLGYLFDPAGDDGVPFNGDEAFQFTGYYFTYNFMVTMGIFQDTLESRMMPLITYFVVEEGLEMPAATVAGADSAADEATQAALVAIGANAALAAGVGAAIGAAVGDLVTLSGSPDTVGEAGQALLVQMLGTALAAGFDPDDSDHDYTQTAGNGRLIFEVDNVCIPEIQTQIVKVIFINQVLAIQTDDSIIPREFALHSNYPNPFNPSTTITFDLPAQLSTEVTVWNLLGQQVRTVYTGELATGRHTVSFDGRDDHGQPLSSGVYFYRVAAGPYISTKKMMLLK